MQVERLKLNYFRNYESLRLAPGSGLNVIFGENAQGKTNAVEAIFLCAFGRSHRTPRDAELISTGMSGAYVGLDVITRAGARSIEVKLRDGERKQLFVDKLECGRSGELMGVLNVVMFSPEDLELIKGAPAERRRFLDMELSQFRPAYYLALQRYNKALRERNALLRPEAVKERTGEALRRELYVWDEQLITLGADIMRRRQEFIEKLAQIAARLHREISGNREQLALAYDPNVKPTGGALEDVIAEALYGSVAEDIRRGYTNFGPHRDDIAISLSGGSVRTYGSQGQQRTAALSVKLSELELLREDRGEPPVLLLDDVLSELDELRQRALLEAVDDCQSFLTCTSLEGLRRAGMDMGNIPAYLCKNGTLTAV
ncbi:MAG TPA: DNA replication/repair protein RecF [Clostridia bacterium]|nr:DNA replication/repair protein RecF [Clostridia bacterium]